MAGLFKPTYKDKKAGKTKRTKKWYAWLMLPDGRRIRTPLATDKSTAQQMLAQLVRAAEQEAHGLSDPFAEHRKRPLAEHLAAWEGSLLSKARPTHRAQAQARQTAGRARLVFEGCGLKLLSDIQPSRVAGFIANLRTDAPPNGNRKRRQQLGLQRLNYHLRCSKQFCRWLVKDRRSPDNPLAHLQGWNARLDRRHDRRALPPPSKEQPGTDKAAG